MKIKAIYHKNELCLATESGEIIENTFSVYYPTGIHATVGKRIQCSFTVIADLEASVKIVEADEKAVRALPAAQSYIELSPEQVEDNLERLRRRPPLEDYDPLRGRRP